jgi:hypothetical protein
MNEEELERLIEQARVLLNRRPLPQIEIRLRRGRNIIAENYEFFGICNAYCISEHIQGEIVPEARWKINGKLRIGNRRTIITPLKQLVESLERL